MWPGYLIDGLATAQIYLNMLSKMKAPVPKPERAQV